MPLFKRLIAGLLYFVILSALFLGSCVGPGVMYAQSSKWFIKDYDEDKSYSFHVAFMAGEVKGLPQLHVELYRGIDYPGFKEQYPDAGYHLPEKKMSYNRDGGGSARITVQNGEQGSQLIQVFVRGDSPWSSLSEYRVQDNQIYPLRHGHSVGWFLLGMFLCPILLVPLSGPLKRSIRRLLRVEPE